MNILDIRLLNGPNYWSIQRHKIVVMLLDLEELENSPTNTIPGFYQRLINLIPSLETHLCREEAPGGFLNRVKEGTWMGHVVEHIALELQSLAGMDTTYGRTVETEKEGIYHVAFSYEEQRAGKYAAQAAVRIAEALVKGEEYNIETDVDNLKKIADEEFPGPSTYSVMKEAINRNIPCIKLNSHSIVQLGLGSSQKRIQATIANTTSCIAVDLAGDKEATKRILENADIPVPKGVIICEEDELKEAVEYVGFPVAIKPVDGNQGKGATTEINTIRDAIEAVKAAKKYSGKVICESSISGYDFRALVINYKFVAAAMRTPAAVKGDGVHTISQLIEIENKNPKRGDGHSNVLTAIRVDDATINVLDKKGYTLETVLGRGEECWLKPTANLSTGGTATDVTDIVHPANIALFERIARVIGLDICGIDVIATNLSSPVKETGGAVLEVNAAPGFRMHLDPTHGKPRNVAGHVLDMLFPNDDQGTIPIVAVTGTNGKTTTTRLIAHIAKKVGYKVGYTTTDGIYIKDDLVVKGDCSGPASAQVVLQDSGVEFAVLECARGGILRAGLGFPFCHAAVITNVAEDHLGLNGIDTIEKLARVKAVVAETVLPTGYAILNADDDLVYAMKDNVKSKVALFSMYENNLRIKRHCEEGGLAAIYSHSHIIIQQGAKRIQIEKVGNIPVTFGGKAQFNIENVLGATLAAYVNNFNLDDIRAGLQTFIPSPEATPGRLNMFHFSKFTVMVDYAHNPHGINAMGKFIKSIDASVKIGIIAGVGDRRDTDLMNVGEEAAKIFDEIIVKLDEDLRGRTAEEIFGLITAGIKGYDPLKKITLHTDECEAVEIAITNAANGAFITVLTDNITKVLHCVRELQKAEQQKERGVNALI
jgi:cyanophycin synthetase